MQMPGQRSGFVTDPFHKVAVAANAVDVMIDDLMSRPVVTRGEPCLRDCHPDAVRETLPQRSSGDVHAHGVASFGVAWCFAAPLAEVLDLVQCKIVSGQMKKTVQEHRPMTS